MSPVRWGVLSTGNIAREMVEAARRSEAARFVAVASRGDDRARRFADDVGLELAFASYQALLECDGVDAVYVALPISMHIEWTVRALRAGRHVLCEKPFAVSPEDARQAFDAAADARRVCAEGLMYRYHPQTRLAQRLVEQGSIELETVSGAIAGGARLPFGPADAIDQAAALQALARSGETAAPVVLS